MSSWAVPDNHQNSAWSTSASDWTHILDAIKEEYLATFIKDGGSSFKLVVGIYGGGKTHFLYCVRDAGWAQHFAVSYVSLKERRRVPF